MESRVKSPRNESNKTTESYPFSVIILLIIKLVHDD